MKKSRKCGTSRPDTPINYKIIGTDAKETAFFQFVFTQKAVRPQNTEFVDI
jgi:hypothetical protein